MIFDSISVIIPLIIIVLLLVSMIKILREYERGVIFMLGRFWGVKGHGLIIVIPGQVCTGQNLRFLRGTAWGSGGGGAAVSELPTAG